MIRWAWRLFRREWRQQLLVLALLVVARRRHRRRGGGGHQHATPGRRGLRHRAGHGHAPRPARTWPPRSPRCGSAFGRVDVIENQTVAMPGSVSTYDLRAQDPHGAFGQPMLSLVSGHYPAGPGRWR